MIIDLADRLDALDISKLISLSMGNPNEARITETLHHYRSEDAWHLFGDERERLLLGCVGFTVDGQAGELRHIAVRPEHRGTGIGKAMLVTAVDRFDLSELTAETDQEAVGFYRKCGFRVESLGERYPGTERYRCTLQILGRRGNLFSARQSTRSGVFPVMLLFQGEADCKSPFQGRDPKSASDMDSMGCEGVR